MRVVKHMLFAAVAMTIAAVSAQAGDTTASVRRLEGVSRAKDLVVREKLSLRCEGEIGDRPSLRAAASALRAIAVQNQIRNLGRVIRESK